MIPIPSRRQFLATTASGLLACSHSSSAISSGLQTQDVSREPIIDIHQHTTYRQRSNATLAAHQRAMGVTRTILLPSGSAVQRPSTGDGKQNGLGGVGAGGNATVVEMAREYADEFVFGSNEVTDLPEARDAIEKQLKAGAVIIGEQKFAVACDSRESQILYALAADYQVPILLHFQHGAYNLGFEFFEKMLQKFPKTNFIGHAQTWWANIDANHKDQTVLYPRGRVTSGGMTDKLLSDYPNVYADMSAGSGLNALERDEDHARGFLERHQNKILYGSDCDDHAGVAPKCQGAKTIAAVRRLSPNKSIERKILFENSKRLFRLT